MEFDPTDLGKEWERCDAVRERLRDGHPLLVASKSKGNHATIPDCTANEALLRPALCRLLVCKLKLPSIPSLRPQVQAVYALCQRTPDDSEIDDSAWEIRKLMRFIKRKAQREEPSQDTLTQP